MADETKKSIFWNKWVWLVGFVFAVLIGNAIWSEYQLVQLKESDPELYLETLKERQPGRYYDELRQNDPKRFADEQDGYFEYLLKYEEEKFVDLTYEKRPELYETHIRSRLPDGFTKLEDMPNEKLYCGTHGSIDYFAREFVKEHIRQTIGGSGSTFPSTEWELKAAVDGCRWHILSWYEPDGSTVRVYYRATIDFWVSDAGSLNYRVAAFQKL